MWGVCVSVYKHNTCKESTITVHIYNTCVYNWCTAQPHPCFCPSGGLVSLHLRGCRGLTCHRHLAQLRGVSPGRGTMLLRHPRLSLTKGYDYMVVGPFEDQLHHHDTLCCLLTNSLRADVRSWILTLHHCPVGDDVHRTKLEHTGEQPVMFAELKIRSFVLPTSYFVTHEKTVITLSKASGFKFLRFCVFRFEKSC